MSFWECWAPSLCRLNTPLCLTSAELMVLPPSSPRKIIAVSHQQSALHSQQQTGCQSGEKMIFVQICGGWPRIVATVVTPLYICLCPDTWGKWVPHTCPSELDLGFVQRHCSKVISIPALMKNATWMRNPCKEVHYEISFFAGSALLICSAWAQVF